MAQPYVGEIRMFAGNFAPVGWFLCDGGLVPISEFETLFQLIGTTYGGDGQSNFALPDLRGRIPMHKGNGVPLALSGGFEEITLTVNQIPAHTHPLQASADPATTLNPQNNVASATATATPYFNIAPATPLAPQAISPTGDNQPHNNMQPYQCINFIISLFGIFPPPS